MVESRSSVFQPRRSANRRYIRSRSPANRRRLLAALARLDLEDDVLVVVGVTRHQQFVQPLLQLCPPSRKLLRLGSERGIFGASSRAVASSAEVCSQSE